MLYSKEHLVFRNAFCSAQHGKTLILKGSSWCFCVVKIFCRVVRMLVWKCFFFPNWTKYSDILKTTGNSWWFYFLSCEMTNKSNFKMPSSNVWAFLLFDLFKYMFTLSKWQPKDKTAYLKTLKTYFCHCIDLKWYSEVQFCHPIGI